MNDKVNNFLAHYGVLGMKWGKRTRRVASSDHTAVSSLKRKKVSELSNAEMQKVVSRKQLEKSYKEQTGSKIKKMVAGAAAGIGTILVADLVRGSAKTINTVSVKATNTAIEKISASLVKDLVKDFNS